MTYKHNRFQRYYTIVRFLPYKAFLPKFTYVKSVAEIKLAGIEPIYT